LQYINDLSTNKIMYTSVKEINIEYYDNKNLFSLIMHRIEGKKTKIGTV